MYKSLALLTIALLTGCQILGPGPTRGQALPPIELEVPEKAAEKVYLGLTGESGTFGFDDIRGDVLVVEVFNTYCPYCQKAAPMYNRLFDRLRQSAIAGRAKMIGIAGGNPEFAAETFEDKYSVLFPVFADPQSKNQKALGVSGVPHLTVIDLRGSQATVMFTEEGGVNLDVQSIIDRIGRALGVE